MIAGCSRNSKSHFARICLLIGELAIRGTNLTLINNENNSETECGEQSAKDFVKTF